MVAAPPDILVTNTSMLNVMLMRDVEDPLFDATAQWLRRDPSNAFTLVVDELHSYRGTQGTEVALVVRNLLRRPGHRAPELATAPRTATSASLAGEEGRDFLQGFFGEERGDFAIIEGGASPRRTSCRPAGQGLFAALSARMRPSQTCGRLRRHMEPARRWPLRVPKGILAAEAALRGE